MGKISDSLQRAVEQTFTRKPPVSTKARVQFLKERLKSTRAVADLLGVSQRSVERYLDGTRRHPPKAVTDIIDREVKARFQPLVRKRAVARAAGSTGITVETRAQFGYVAAAGSTDDGRVRRLTAVILCGRKNRNATARDLGPCRTKRRGPIFTVVLRNASGWLAPPSAVT